MRGKLAKQIRRWAKSMTKEENLRPAKYIVNKNTGVVRLFPKCEKGLYRALKQRVLAAKR